MLGFTGLWASRMLSVLRIVAALLFIEHGTQKLFAIPPPPQPIPFHLVSLLGLATILELGGGLLLLFGLFTRPVAFILSGEMAVAYFKSHFPHGFLPLANRGEVTVLYCFLFLYFFFAGSGPWSLDHRLRGKA